MVPHPRASGKVCVKSSFEYRPVGRQIGWMYLGKRWFLKNSKYLKGKGRSGRDFKKINGQKIVEDDF